MKPKPQKTKPLTKVETPNSSDERRNLKLKMTKPNTQKNETLVFPLKKKKKYKEKTNIEFTFIIFRDQYPKLHVCQQNKPVHFSGQSKVVIDRSK